MSEPWIVELIGGARQIVEAASMAVSDGHLLATDHGEQVAGWAPEVWGRFWRRPSDGSLDGLRARLAGIERLLERAPDDLTRLGLEQCRDGIKVALADLQDLQDRRGA